MSQQLIGTGTFPNDAAGDPLQTAFKKTNSNFTELYNNNFGYTNVLTFGADATGIKDSTAAINAADLAATNAGQILYFPAGVYNINQNVRVTMNGCSWRGAGQNASILKSVVGTYPVATNMVTCSGKSNLTIADLGFDMSLVTFTNGTTSRHLLMFNCSNWTVRNCAFTGIQAYNLAIYPNGGSNWEIADCYFNQSIPSTQQSQAINVQAATGVHQICRNILVGTAIFSGTGGGIYSDNIITGWQFGSGITLGTPPTNIGNYNRVVGNYLLNGGGNPDVNSTYGAGIECWSPYSTIVGNHCVGMTGSGISVGAPNCVVIGNECINNTQTGQAQGGITVYGKLVSATQFTASNSIIVNNQLSDNQGSHTQQYGYIEYQNVAGSAPLTNILVSANQALGNVAAAYLFASTTPAANSSNGSLNLAGGVGFFGASAPGSRPTVSGSKGGNAALASLMTALAANGIVTDSTT